MGHEKRNGKERRHVVCVRSFARSFVRSFVCSFVIQRNSKDENGISVKKREKEKNE
jgi:hypothetical protein